MDGTEHGDVVLKHQQVDTTEASSGSVGRNGGSEAHYVCAARLMMGACGSWQKALSV